jgi:hypothetical protein
VHEAQFFFAIYLRFELISTPEGAFELKTRLFVLLQTTEISLRELFSTKLHSAAKVF